jgi:hypothetical protein
MNRYHVTFASASKERRGHAMRKFLTAAMIVVAGSNGAWATNAAFDDILGRWCVVGRGNFNTFSRDQLLVQFPNGSSRTLGILRTEVNGNRIHIYWTIKANADTVYDISDDRRILIQVPNSSGDMGPRLELHRC